MNLQRMFNVFPAGILILSLFLIGITNTAFAQEGEDTAREQAFQVGLSYTADLFTNVAGGNKTGLKYLDNIDADLLIDFAHLPGGPEGTSVYIYGMGNQGGSISRLAGDVQGVSNIEAENSWRIYEFWAQQKFFSLKSSLLAGLYDVNSEFNFLSSSQLFLNSSHGIDPTIAFSGVLGPSIFPYTSLGARLKINPYKGLLIKGAVLDGVPSDPGNTRGTKVFLRERDGLFIIGELSYHSQEIAQGRSNNQRRRLNKLLSPGAESDNVITFGAWYYTQERQIWENAGFSENELGIYGLGELEIVRNTAESPRNLKVFVRAGLVNPNINILNGFFGAGLVSQALIESRPDDQTGIAVAYASASSSYIDNTFISGQRPEKAETNLELTHRFSVNEHISIQANFQYVINPGFDASLDNAVVIGARLTAGL